MKNNRVFLSEYFQFLEVKFSMYLNRRVFIMFSSKLASERMKNSTSVALGNKGLQGCICVLAHA